MKVPVRSLHFLLTGSRSRTETSTCLCTSIRRIWRHSSLGPLRPSRPSTNGNRFWNPPFHRPKKASQGYSPWLAFSAGRSCGAAARKAGGEHGDELRGGRLVLRRTLRYRHQPSPVCFPDQIHRKADAALDIKAAGVIVLRDDSVAVLRPYDCFGLYHGRRCCSLYQMETWR